MCMQIHHALCDMMTSILAPLVRSDQPHSCSHLAQELLGEWYGVVLTLKGDVFTWMNKHPKHVPVSGPGAVHPIPMHAPHIAPHIHKAHGRTHASSLSRASKRTPCCRRWLITHPRACLPACMQDGYPFFTTLVCLMDDENYSAGVDAAVEFMHRGMKVRAERRPSGPARLLACSFVPGRGWEGSGPPATVLYTCMNTCMCCNTMEGLYSHALIGQRT